MTNEVDWDYGVITVTIRGAGTTFYPELAAITNALTELGATVKIFDHHPPSPDQAAAVHANPSLVGRKIIIQTDHLPWGG